MIAASVLLAAPAAMGLAGALHARPPVPDDRLRRLPEAAALLALAASLLAGGLLVAFGPGTSPVLGMGEIGLSARLDAVSVAMAVLTSFLGWVLLRFSATHLRDSGIERRFTAWLCATLCGLLLLATAGYLAQVVAGFLLTGLGLARLLALFSSRPAVARAAVKLRVIARAGDAALLLGAASLAAAHGTSEIEAILAAARTGTAPLAAQVGAGFIALAATLKAALLPAHVWLRAVDETALPLTAFAQTLFVGAGIFLAIRMADLLVAAPLALAGIAALGGATALAAGFVAMTQAGSRGSHSWATVAQSGFAMLLCGLGLFPLALVHLLGHALHRTHAILARDTASAAAPARAPSTGDVLAAMTGALTVYGCAAVAALLLGVAPQVLAVGALLTIGLAGSAAGHGDGDGTRAALRCALLLVPGFLGLQWLAFALTAGALPPVPEAAPLDWALILVALVGFALAALAQARILTAPSHPLMRGLRVHVANGFYLDALADRLLAGRATPHVSKET